MNSHLWESGWREVGNHYTPPQSTTSCALTSPPPADSHAARLSAGEWVDGDRKGYPPVVQSISGTYLSWLSSPELHGSARVRRKRSKHPYAFKPRSSRLYEYLFTLTTTSVSHPLLAT